MTEDEIASILGPYLGTTDEARDDLRSRPELFRQLSVYLDLLARWNGRMNLTAIRDQRVMVARHFGESLFLARQLAPGGSLLDLGSGAGLPGLPVQLWHRGIRVTLAESQTKKASFLREVVRTLSLDTEVWPGRAERMLGERRFDVVVLRAVDAPERALRAAVGLSRSAIWLLASAASVWGSLEQLGWKEASRIWVPEREDSVLVQLRPKSFHVEHQV